MRMELCPPEQRSVFPKNEELNDHEHGKGSFDLEFTKTGQPKSLKAG